MSDLTSKPGWETANACCGPKELTLREKLEEIEKRLMESKLQAESIWKNLYRSNENDCCPKAEGRDSSVESFLSSIDSLSIDIRNTLNDISRKI